MNKLTIAGATASLLICADASAQSVSSRVTGAVGGVTTGVGATAGAGSSAAAGGPDFSVLNSSPGSSVGPGGDWNGGTRARIGGKDVTIRGAVASEGGSSAFKAGAGIPF